MLETKDDIYAFFSQKQSSQTHSADSRPESRSFSIQSPFSARINSRNSNVLHDSQTTGSQIIREGLPASRLHRSSQETTVNDLASLFVGNEGANREVNANEVFPTNQNLPQLDVSDLLRKSAQSESLSVCYRCMAGNIAAVNHHTRMIAHLREEIEELKKTVSQLKANQIANEYRLNPYPVPIQYKFDPYRVPKPFYTEACDGLPSIDLRKVAEATKEESWDLTPVGFAKSFARNAIKELGKMCEDLALFTVRTKRGQSRLKDFPESIRDDIADTALLALGMQEEELPGADPVVYKDDRFSVVQSIKEAICRKLEDLRREASKAKRNPQQSLADDSDRENEEPVKRSRTE